MQENQKETVCVLRFFGAPEAEIRQAAACACASGRLRAQLRSRGGETLLALLPIAAAAEPDGGAAIREAGAACMRERCGAALYGRDGETLPACAAAALAEAEAVFVCCDAATAAQLAPRLRGLPDADRVYDFGARTVENAAVLRNLTRLGSRWAHRHGGGAAQEAVGRVRAACRRTGADYAAALVPCRNGTLVLAGTRKNFWARLLPAGETAPLWLLDILRRAAAGLPQAEGTQALRYGDALSLADEPPTASPAPALSHPEEETPPAPPDAEESAVPTPRPRPLRMLAAAVLLLLFIGGALYLWRNGQRLGWDGARGIWQGALDRLHGWAGEREFSTSGALLL